MDYGERMKENWELLGRTLVGVPVNAINDVGTSVASEFGSLANNYVLRPTGRQYDPNSYAYELGTGKNLQRMSDIVSNRLAAAGMVMPQPVNQPNAKNTAPPAPPALTAAPAFKKTEEAKPTQQDLPLILPSYKTPPLASPLPSFKGPDSTTYGRQQSAMDYQRAPGNFARNDIGYLASMIEDMMSEMRRSYSPWIKGGARKMAQEKYRSLAGLLGNLGTAYGRLAGDTAGLAQEQHKNLMENARGYEAIGMQDRNNLASNAINAQKNMIDWRELFEVKKPASDAMALYHRAGAKSLLAKGEDSRAKMLWDLIGKIAPETVKSDDPERARETGIRMIEDAGHLSRGDRYTPSTPAIKKRFHEDVPAKAGYWTSNEEMQQQQQVLDAFVKHFKGDKRKAFEAYRAYRQNQQR